MLTCASCGMEVTSNMRYAIQKNECPACGNLILDGAGIEQYKLLTTALATKRFTTDVTTDQKIREVVVAFILERFRLVPKTVEVAPSLSTEVVEPQQVVKTPVQQEVVLSEVDGEVEVDEGLPDDKVERLKAVAREGKKLGQGGPKPVRRVDQEES